MFFCSDRLRNKNWGYTDKRCNSVRLQLCLSTECSCRGRQDEDGFRKVWLFIYLAIFFFCLESITGDDIWWKILLVWVHQPPEFHGCAKKPPRAALWSVVFMDISLPSLFGTKLQTERHKQTGVKFTLGDTKQNVCHFFAEKTGT